MTTKDRLIIEINKLPAEFLEEVLAFIKRMKKETKKGKNIPTMKLKGQFDDVDIRKKAYE